MNDISFMLGVATIFAGVLAVGSVATGAEATTAISTSVRDEVKMMDTNADAKISELEHAAGAKTMFDAMDLDRDGKVTATEMDAATLAKQDAKPATGQLSSAEKIAVIDTDKDGALASAEHAAGSRSMFAKMDTNADGYVTPEELQAGHDAMLKKKA